MSPFTHTCKLKLSPIPLTALSVAIVFVAAAVRVKAGTVDEGFLRNAPRIIQAVAQQNVQRVGVLDFLVQREGYPSEFKRGLANREVADKLLSSLVLSLDSAAPQVELLLPVDDAGTCVDLSYRTSVQRARLFQTRLRSLAGAKLQKPDGFLAGKMRVSRDRSTATITVGLLLSRDRAIDLLEFTVPMDRATLASLGQGFSISASDKKYLKGFFDDAAISGLGKESDRPATKRSGSSLQAIDMPVELSVYYRDPRSGTFQVQQLKKDQANRGPLTFTIREPKPGEVVQFGLKNTTSNTVGVALTVNGVNTLREERGSPDSLSKWVLAPKKQYRVKGFHTADMKTFIEIKAMSAEQSEKMFEKLGGKAFAGLIHLHVFEKRSSEVERAPEFTRTLGHLSDGDMASYATNLKSLQIRLAQKSTLAPGGSRGLFGWGSEGNETLRQTPLGTTDHTKTLVIRYYTKP